MDPNRRYSDEEIAQILDDATETQTNRDHALSSSDGLTLAELQEIGLEAGIGTDLIAQAASRLERADPSASPHRSFLGTPIGVGRTVHLDRPLTDQEWGRLVVDLRETFDARGQLHEEGSFRQWTNGNLQALLEPTESGERLRLKTLKSGAKEGLGMGATLMAIAPVLYLLFLLVNVGGSGAVGLPLLMGLAGAVLYGTRRISLPHWAATRQLQMDGVAERLTASVQAADQTPVEENDT